MIRHMMMLETKSPWSFEFNGKPIFRAIVARFGIINGIGNSWVGYDTSQRPIGGCVHGADVQMAALHMIGRIRAPGTVAPTPACQCNHTYAPLRCTPATNTWPCRACERLGHHSIISLTCIRVVIPATGVCTTVAGSVTFYPGACYKVI